MKRNIIVGLLMCLLGLPGCGMRVYNWGASNFYQGESVTDFTCVPQHYIRSVKLYSQFTTEAAFDVLWLSHDVRSAYAQAYALKHGKNEDIKRAILRRQLAENRHFISFVVLTSYSNVLGDKSSKWAFQLKVNDILYEPKEIKLIDISPEYQAFFGIKFNKFKDAYQLIFDATDTATGNDIITENSETMTLIIRSLQKMAELTWYVPQADRK